MWIPLVLAVWARALTFL
uniref:Uncharacterized protein n=1 Tax=Arundo donax TaxID=35708 RepID=A0A0A8ZVB7_ARUDO